MDKIGAFALDIIHNVDALQAIRRIPNRSVQMVFMDPPYGHNNNNNGDLISRREAALGYRDYVPEKDNRPIVNDGIGANVLFKSILSELNRILLPGGCLCCCGGGGPNPQFARWSLWIDDVFDFKQMVVWDKGPMGMGWHYRRSYEVVLVAEKPGPHKWFGGSITENIIRPGNYGIKKIIPSVEEHPTEKPIELAAHFIKLHSEPGDIIFDPFAGSGSTGVAALRLGRRFLGFEIDPYWSQRGNMRLEAFRTNTTVMAMEKGQTTLF